MLVALRHTVAGRKYMTFYNRPIYRTLTFFFFNLGRGSKRSRHSNPFVALSTASFHSCSFKWHAAMLLRSTAIS